MSRVTSTQRRALLRLREHGGTGVKMKNGCVLAGGVVLRSGDHIADADEPEFETNDRLTWPVFERLCLLGLVTIEGDRVSQVVRA